MQKCRVLSSLRSYFNHIACFKAYASEEHAVVCLVSFLCPVMTRALQDTSFMARGSLKVVTPVVAGLLRQAFCVAILQRFPVTRTECLKIWDTILWYSTLPDAWSKLSWETLFPYRDSVPVSFSVIATAVRAEMFKFFTTSFFRVFIMGTLVSGICCFRFWEIIVTLSGTMLREISEASYLTAKIREEWELLPHLCLLEKVWV